jgi:hypothetical protein
MAAFDVITDDYAGNDLAAAVGTLSGGEDISLAGSAHFTVNPNISSVELGSVEIRDDVEIGGPGSSMTVDLSGASGVLVMRSNRSVRVAAGGSGGEIQTARVMHAPDGIYFTGGAVPLLEQLNGKSDFNSAVDLQAASISGGSCTIDVHASHTVDALTIGAGAVTLRRSITASTGTCVVHALGELTTDERAMTINSITVSGVWHVNNGNVAAATLLPGARVDFSQLETDMAFTALTVWPGVTVIGDVPVGVTVTWPTPTKVAGGSIGPWG